MRTTIEIPNPLFRRAKSRAAERGQSLKQLVTEALQEKLDSRARSQRTSQPRWMEGFGRLRALRSETRRLEARVDEAFERVEPEDRT